MERGAIPRPLVPERGDPALAKGDAEKREIAAQSVVRHHDGGGHRGGSVRSEQAGHGLSFRSVRATNGPEPDRQAVDSFFSPRDAPSGVDLRVTPWQRRGPIE